MSSKTVSPDEPSTLDQDSLIQLLDQLLRIAKDAREVIFEMQANNAFANLPNIGKKANKCMVAITKVVPPESDLPLIKNVAPSKVTTEDAEALGIFPRDLTLAEVTNPELCIARSLNGSARMDRFHDQLDRLESMLVIKSEADHRMIVDRFVTEALAFMDDGLPELEAGTGDGVFLKAEFGAQKQMISPAHNADKLRFQVTARTDLLTGITSISRSTTNPVIYNARLTHEEFWRDEVKGRWAMIEVKKGGEMTDSIPQVVFTALALREKYGSDTTNIVRFVLATAYAWQFGYVECIPVQVEGKSKYRVYCTREQQYNPDTSKRNLQAPSSAAVRQQREEVLLLLQEWLGQFDEQFTQHIGQQDVRH